MKQLSRVVVLVLAVLGCFVALAWRVSAPVYQRRTYYPAFLKRLNSLDMYLYRRRRKMVARTAMGPDHLADLDALRAAIQAITQNPGKWPEYNEGP